MPRSWGTAWPPATKTRLKLALADPVTGELLRAAMASAAAEEPAQLSALAEAEARLAGLAGLTDPDEATGPPH
jgi:hypothetical protein